jgi:NTE family protein
MMASSYLDYIDFSVKQAMSGPILGSQLQQFVLKNTGCTNIEQLRIPFIAVATDLNTGDTIPITHGDLGLAVHASCALPSLIRPVQFANVILVDGGVTDPVPVDIAKLYHPKLIIAVNISSEPKNNVRLTMPNILGQSLNLMMMALTRYNVKEADIIIRPKVGYISMFDLSKKERLYQEGLSAGRKAIPEIRRKLLINHLTRINFSASKSHD